MRYLTTILFLLIALPCYGESKPKDSYEQIVLEFKSLQAQYAAKQISKDKLKWELDNLTKRVSKVHIRLWEASPEHQELLSRPKDPNKRYALIPDPEDCPEERCKIILFLYYFHLNKSDFEKGDY